MDTFPPHNEISAEQIPGRPLVQEAKPEPCAIVIFGITGDLAKRKLVPALYNLVVDGATPERFAIVGLTRGTEGPARVREREDRRPESVRRHEGVPRCRRSRKGHER